MSPRLRPIGAVCALLLLSGELHASVPCFSLPQRLRCLHKTTTVASPSQETNTGVPAKGAEKAIAPEKIPAPKEVPSGTTNLPASIAPAASVTLNGPYTDKVGQAIKEWGGTTGGTPAVDQVITIDGKQYRLTITPVGGTPPIPIGPPLDGDIKGLQDAFDTDKKELQARGLPDVDPSEILLQLVDTFRDAATQIPNVKDPKATALSTYAKSRLAKFKDITLLDHTRAWCLNTYLGKVGLADKLKLPLAGDANLKKSFPDAFNEIADLLGKVK